VGFGWFVKKMRGKAKCTQTEFADRLGVHWTTISKWERNKQAVPYSKMDKMVKLHYGDQYSMKGCILLPDEEIDPRFIDRVVAALADKGVALRKEQLPRVKDDKSGGAG
jgi:transcriptional regulator with XRE-family HTH domain